MDKFILAPLEVLTDARLSDSERKVLLALFSFRGRDTNIVFPSIEKLAERCNIKDKTRISKLTKSLADKGWLNKSRQGFSGKINYQMTIPELAEFTNLAESTKKANNTKTELAESTKMKLAESTSFNKEDNEEDHIKSIKKTSKKDDIDYSLLCMNDAEVEEVKQIRKTNKGGKLTQRVINTLGKEFAQCRLMGMDNEDILNEWASRGWKGFKAVWINFGDLTPTPPSGGFPVNRAEQRISDNIEKSKGWLDRAK